MHAYCFQEACTKFALIWRETTRARTSLAEPVKFCHENAEWASLWNESPPGIKLILEYSGYHVNSPQSGRPISTEPHKRDARFLFN